MPSDQMKAEDRIVGIGSNNMHTQKKDGDVQFAVTLTWAATNAEKRTKDATDGATERIRGDISYPKAKGTGGGRGRTWHDTQTQMHRFEGLMGAP
jgi:hypothetical protein